jgi:nicotinate dehydrogenase subunit A
MDEDEFRLTVNGAERSVTCEPDTPLLDVLRHDLGLAGPRFGCGMGLCGACFVLIEGRARSSCDLPVSAAGGQHRQVAAASSILSSRRSSTSRPPSAATAPRAW